MVHFTKLGMNFDLIDHVVYRGRSLSWLNNRRLDIASIDGILKEIVPWYCVVTIVGTPFECWEIHSIQEEVESTTHDGLQRMRDA